MKRMRDYWTDTNVWDWRARTVPSWVFLRYRNLVHRPAITFQPLFHSSHLSVCHRLVFGSRMSWHRIWNRSFDGQQLLFWKVFLFHLLFTAGSLCYSLMKSLVTACWYDLTRDSFPLTKPYLWYNRQPSIAKGLCLRS